MSILDREINIYEAVHKYPFCEEGYDDLADVIGVDYLCNAKHSRNKDEVITLRQLIEIFPKEYEVTFDPTAWRRGTHSQIWNERALNVGFFIFKALGAEECCTFGRCDGATGITRVLLAEYRKNENKL